ncbi:hypothetical protein HYC85_028360 [Camellia sinensis]|uniref:Uncharacterized protein n=1 Tax=Camellia sinensis TaxID=4442 RepID=A0A7J7FV82_CAMSI|nr:hypothetical protein HYC85_028360 [Camellia sinensis]
MKEDFDNWTYVLREAGLYSKQCNSGTYIASDSEFLLERGCATTGRVADLQLTSVDDALLGSLDVIRSVQIKEWNILIHSNLCFALGLIPRCLEDVRVFCPFAVSFSGAFFRQDDQSSALRAHLAFLPLVPGILLI